MSDLTACFPPAVRRGAAEIIAAQATVPLSPAARSAGGALELCAAAALAVAGTGTPQHRQSVLARLERGDRETLLDIFEELGWSRHAGSGVLIANDALAPERRKAGVLRLLAADGH